MGTTNRTRFALGTFAQSSEDPFAALVIADEVFPLVAGSSVRGLLEDWDRSMLELQRAADRCVPGSAPHRLAELRVQPPVLPVGEIFQAGANYREHVLGLFDAAQRRGDNADGVSEPERERGRRALDERAATGAPFVFQGSAHAVCSAVDDIVLPTEGDQPDWELELAAVIGRAARRVPRERAMEHVAGYMIANDLTLRDRLHRADVPGGLDWLAAKNPPTFLPLGPVLVPAVHSGDPMCARMTLSVNDRVMQDATTADMLFDIAAMVAYVSEIAELRPGDLVLTGSPAGNGAHHGTFLSPGDVLEGRIEGLGVQRNRCIAERAAPASTPAVASGTGR